MDECAIGFCNNREFPLFQRLRPFTHFVATEQLCPPSFTKVVQIGHHENQASSRSTPPHISIASPSHPHAMHQHGVVALSELYQILLNRAAIGAVDDFD